MSHLFRIDLAFAGPIGPFTVLSSLHTLGWEVSHEEQVHYMLEGDGDFEWQFAPAAGQAVVVQRLEQALGAGQHVAIGVHWRGGHGGDILFFPGDEGRITFTGSFERQVLETDPPFTDIGWYVTRLLPPLIRLDLIELVVVDRP